MIRATHRSLIEIQAEYKNLIVNAYVALRLLAVNASNAIKLDRRKKWNDIHQQ